MKEIRFLIDKEVVFLTIYIILYNIPASNLTILLHLILAIHLADTEMANAFPETFANHFMICVILAKLLSMYTNINLLHKKSGI
jgi:hypothetical protein